MTMRFSVCRLHYVMFECSTRFNSGPGNHKFQLPLLIALINLGTCWELGFLSDPRHLPDVVYCELGSDPRPSFRIE